ncbi:hypothetical protein B0H12DRAFT_1133592 [Mycena haematopus]|nr:hypothetical protein B0H12DRAFT_1133592 [Mycena haematopus]
MPWSKAPSAFNRPEASWRRMLVAQPPPQKMLVTETCHGSGSFVRRAVYDDEPLRMGSLYDIVLPLVDRVVSSFCVRWHHDDNPKSDIDITLTAVYIEQTDMAPRPVLDMHFYSTLIRHGNNLRFGEWNVILRSPTPESLSEDSDEKAD